MKKRLIWWLGALIMVSLTACGGSDSGSDSPSGAPGSGGSPNTAAKVDGNYTGSYTTNLIPSTPFALSLSRSGSIVTGQFTSTKISGSVSGSVNDSGTVEITITEPRSLGTVNMTLLPSGQNITVSSVTGTDLFGKHTSGTGFANVAAAPPVTLFANGYNGVATFINMSPLPLFGTQSGTYPVSITGILPDGSGGYSGTIKNKFAAGLLSIVYVPAAAKYVGTIYQGNDAPNWIVGDGGFNISDMENNLYMYRLHSTAADVYTSSCALHSGDFIKVLPGTWSYTNPDSAAIGVQSLTATIVSGNGISYIAQVSAVVRQVVGGPVDTISGTLVGTYDLNPTINNHTGARVFQLGLVATSPLTITNNSGATTNFAIYIAWVDNSTSPLKSLISVDTGNRAWPDITLTR